MFQVDVENGDLPNLSDRLNPPAVIQTVKADELSIASALRGGDSSDLAEVQKGLAEFLRYDSAKKLIGADFKEAADLLVSLKSFAGSEWVQIFQIDLPPKEREVLTDSVVGALLINIGRELNDPTLRLKFGGGTLSQREQLEVLEYASTEDRLDFFRTLHQLSTTNQEVAGFVARKLDNAFHFLPASERVLFSEELARGIGSSTNCAFLAQVFRNASDFEQFSQMVRAAGLDSLLGSKDSKLIECAAQVVLLGQVQNLSLPASVSLATSPQDIVLTFRELEQLFCEIKNICTADPILRETDIAKRLLWGAAYNLAYLESDCAFLQWAGDAKTEMCELANSLIKKCDLETRFGVLLTHEEFNGVEMSLGRRWTQADLQDIEQVLERIGEGRLFMTPLLHEIRRVSDLGDNIMGVRFPDGRIAIADLAVNNKSFASLYGGPSSLELVLTHELGHAAQLGIFYGDVKFDPAKGWCIDEGDPAYDFSEYMQLSGWRMIDPERYSFVNGPYVVIDDQLLPLEFPVEIGNEKLVLVKCGNILLAYNEDADFSSRWYSKVNPWEDFAEAFMEYYLAPEKLLQSAPEKFRFLEQELHYYEQHPEALEALTRNLNPEQRKAA